MNRARFILFSLAVMAIAVFFAFQSGAKEAGNVRVGTFAVDATPPIGSPMAYDPIEGVQTPLTQAPMW